MARLTTALLLAGPPLLTQRTTAGQGPAPQPGPGGGRPGAEAGPGAGADRAAPGAASPGQRYRRLVEEFRGFQRQVTDEAAALKTEEQRRSFFRARWPLPDRFADRFLALARAHPDDPAAFDALAWVVVFAYSSPESDAAAALLVRDWGHDRRLWPLCQELSRGPISMARGEILRAVARGGPDRATRGRACLALGRLLKQESEFVRDLKTPGVTPWQAQLLTRDRIEKFKDLDPTRLAGEAERSFERVTHEFADVRPVRLVRDPNYDPHAGYDWDVRKVFELAQDAEEPGGTLADLARSDLDELRSPGVGQTAPEVTGRDVDGKTFRLSDYRGKVVVLTFSGNWCGPCRAMYPHERALVKRLSGRPFALLSVNTDEDKETLRKSIETGEITWRCWWEGGGTKGEIPARWGVKHWPTIYIIDPKGVVRHKFIGALAENEDRDNPPMYETIQNLLKEAGAAGAPGNRPPPGVRPG